MQIVKEKIYMVNKATADEFFNDAVEQGFLVSDNLKYNDGLVEKLNSNHYVPMTFHSNDFSYDKVIYFDEESKIITHGDEDFVTEYDAEETCCNPKRS